MNREIWKRMAEIAIKQLEQPNGKYNPESLWLIGHLLEELFKISSKPASNETIEIKEIKDGLEGWLYPVGYEDHPYLFFGYHKDDKVGQKICQEWMFHHNKT